MDKQLKARIKVAEDVAGRMGVTVANVAHGKKHSKIYLEYAGHQRFVTLSRTSSDFRSIRNHKMRVREACLNLRNQCGA